MLACFFNIGYHSKIKILIQDGTVVKINSIGRMSKVIKKGKIILVYNILL